MTTRRPTPAELGLDVTIAIVAIAQPGNHFVTVSDRMISYDDITQAEDNAVLKARRVAHKWGIMFAASDARLFRPIARRLVEKTHERGSDDGTMDPTADFDLEKMKELAAASYREIFEDEFVARFLSRLNIKSVEYFRKNGLAELGRDVFDQIYRELARFDLGISLLVFGYDQINEPHIFEIENPGRAVDHNLLGYAVIGSGYWMASASLRSRPLERNHENLIYRCLEAKFAAETATAVGVSTTVLTFKAGHHDTPGTMASDAIQTIKDAIKERLSMPPPQEAIAAIKNSKAFKVVMDETAENKLKKPSVSELEQSS